MQHSTFFGTLHCVAYFYAGVVLGWKPGQSSKFRPILTSQDALTDFHGGEAKKTIDWDLSQCGPY